jgi:hypothetical protein
VCAQFAQPGRKHAIFDRVAAPTAVTAADATAHPALAFYKAFGGSFDDIAEAVAVDSAGNAYVAGYTSSPDFPVKNGFQSRLGGVRLRSSTDGGKTWSSIDIPAAVLRLRWTVPGMPTLRATIPRRTSRSPRTHSRPGSTVRTPGL